MEQRINERLTEAAQEGNINTLYALIREDPFLLVRIDQVPFVHTPLHTAAAAGRMQFAMEMMNLKPSFARKLNQDGFSPMHLALQHGHAEIVHQFVEIDRDLIRVKGREGITPLHYVAETGDLNLLAEFLSTCEESIKDLTIRMETVLHIAVKNNMFEALEVLVGWLQKRTVYKDAQSWKKMLINWKDDEGNTVLHIATFRNQPQVVRLLIHRSTININAKNLEGLTALDISGRQTQLDNREVRDLLSRTIRPSLLILDFTSLAYYLRYYKILLRDMFGTFGTLMRGMRPPSDVANLQLVVAVLIITATYQAVLSPPGGVWQDDYNPPSLNTTLSEGNQRPHLAGKSVMEEKDWDSFMHSNTTALLFSLATTCLLIPIVPCTLFLFFSLYFLVYCYSLSVSVISPSQIGNSSLSFASAPVLFMSIVLYFTHANQLREYLTSRTCNRMLASLSRRIQLQ